MTYNEILKAAAKLTDEEKDKLANELINILQGEYEVGVLQTQQEQTSPPSCPHCQSPQVIRRGSVNGRQKYTCKACKKHFSATTGTVMYHLKEYEKMGKYIRYMLEGMSLRELAEAVGLSLQTTFDWRHKILTALSTTSFDQFEGIVEMDEFYLHYSQTGDDKLDRPPRKRGSQKGKRGISNDLVNILVVYDRTNHLELRVGSRGYLRHDRVKELLSERIKEESVVCSDMHKGLRSFIKELKVSHITINAGKKEYVKGIYHIQHVNSLVADIRCWIRQFKGVATKYLQNYMSWFNMLHQISNLAEPTKQFIKNTVATKSAWAKWHDIKLNGEPGYLLLSQ